MDPQAIGNWLSNEIVVAAHVSFWVAVCVVGILIWRAMEWRYRGTIEKLKEERGHVSKATNDRVLRSQKRIWRLTG